MTSWDRMLCTTGIDKGSSYPVNEEQMITTTSDGIHE